jgi:homoserine O-acetyltransferase
MEEWLADEGLERDTRATSLHAMTKQWAGRFDANSTVTLLDALLSFEVKDELASERAKVLLVLPTTNALFSANEGPAIARLLARHGADIAFRPLQRAYGHLASGLDRRGCDEPLRQLIGG